MKESQNKRYEVSDKYRTNSLSLKPGGSTVCVQDRNGFIKEYTKVKFPGKFIQKVLEESDHNTQCWVKK